MRRAQQPVPAFSSLIMLLQVAVKSGGFQRSIVRSPVAHNTLDSILRRCGNGPAGTEPKRDLPPRAAYLEMLKDTCPWSLYRVSLDLGPTFPSTVYNVNRGLPFLKRGPGTVPLSRPGCWMYPDMMMVGVTKMRQDPREPPMPVVDPNPMTPTEWRTHFAMWAVTSSPLILGFDLTNDTMLRAAWPIGAARPLVGGWTLPASTQLVLEQW